MSCALKQGCYDKSRILKDMKRRQAKTKIEKQNERHFQA
jgi:hypothetical protein